MGGTPTPWQEAADSFSGQALAAGDAVGWFDRLYAAGADGAVTMPWDRAEGHPLLVDWTARRSFRAGARAMVVGCGLGADAEHVASLGLATTAFDVSPTAVQMARERFPDSPVDYRVADLLDLPSGWARAFDLVVEIFTLQALPTELHARAGRATTDLIADGGTQLSIGSVPRPGEPPPFPLTRAELEGLATGGVVLTALERLAVPGTSEQRWRAEYRREPG